MEEKFTVQKGTCYYFVYDRKGWPLAGYDSREKAEQVCADLNNADFTVDN